MTAKQLDKERAVPTLEDLPSDIYHLFDDEHHHEINEENLNAFLTNVENLLRTRLAALEERGGVLRFSNLGRPNRQLWFQQHHPELAEKLSPKTLFKFLYGDLLEQLILFLAKEAGHEVTDEQAEVEVDGVLGHIDAKIDGVTVDVKSASPNSYRKFDRGTLFEDDPFGYIGQLSGYANIVSPDVGGAFVAFDKVHGDICILRVGPSITSHHRPAERVAELKAVLGSDAIPERCYPDVPDGQSGNRKLGTNCSYCAFRDACWADSNDGQGLRTYFYSGGPRFLTRVEKEPNVPEKK